MTSACRAIESQFHAAQNDFDCFRTAMADVCNVEGPDRDEAFRAQTRTIDVRSAVLTEVHKPGLVQSTRLGAATRDPGMGAECVAAAGCEPAAG